jgi:hypothetical protein
MPIMTNFRSEDMPGAVKPVAVKPAAKSTVKKPVSKVTVEKTPQVLEKTAEASEEVAPVED